MNHTNFLSFVALYTLSIMLGIAYVLSSYPWYIAVSTITGIWVFGFIAHLIIADVIQNVESSIPHRPFSKTSSIAKSRQPIDQNRTDCGKIVKIAFITNEDDDIKSRVTTTTGTFLLQGYASKELEGDIASIRDDKFYIGLFSQNNSFEIAEPSICEAGQSTKAQ